MGLSFTELVHSGVRLPDNYLPSALPLLMGDDPAPYYPLVPVPMLTSSGESRPVVAVSGDDLADAGRISTVMSRQPDSGPFFAGPPMRTSGIPFQSSDTDAPPARTGDADVIGLIDAGFAFWNPVFNAPGSQAGTSRVIDVGFLDFDREDGMRPAVDFVGQTNLNDMVNTAAQTGGERRVIHDLGQKFPGSVFGKSPDFGRLFDPDGFNHGTAVADLAGGAATALGQSRPETEPFVFAVELPSSALLDGSGETLQALVSVALRELLARILDWQRDTGLRPNLRIVLPFAFLGGPVDGSHPVVQNIKNVVDTKSGDMPVQVYLPMGNHLQDQAHARIQDVPANTLSDPLTWYLRPDDFSPNTVEVTFRGASELTLHLAPPSGRSAVASLRSGAFGVLEMDGKTVGAIWCRKIDDTWSRLRISLGGTDTKKPNFPRLPYGDWTLRLETGSEPLKSIDFWILREDGTRFQKQLPPARQSYFRDQNYRRFMADGSYARDDDAATYIKRLGSASLIATLPGQRIICVGAKEHYGGRERPAWYSGLYKDKAHEPTYHLVDDGRPGVGLHARGGGGPRVYRMSGTSAAVAARAKFR
ncbi:MAG: hypothetical protein AAF408_11460 [Pseudomonadota bacterium]